MVITGDESDGWWRGTNASGLSGVFPNNFVEEFFETVEDPKSRGNPAPPKTARPPNEPPKPAGAVPPAKPDGALGLKPTTARLSTADSDTPPVSVRPNFAKPPVAAKAPEPSASAATGAAARPASPPPMEKKKFNTPAPAGAKPAAAAEGDGELMKKLSVRNAASEGETPAPEPTAKPDPPLPSRSLPSKPTPPLANKPAPVVTVASTISAVVIEEDDDQDSPSDDSPKLHHATKDRPKIGSNRRKPQRRSFSVGGAGQPEADEEKPPAAGPTLTAPPSDQRPRLPDRSASAPVVTAEPALPERPKLTKPTVAALATPAASAKADPQTLPEVKEWFQQELAALRKELQEERAARKVLEERLAKLERK